MKNLFLIAAITAVFLSTSAKAETINCIEITSVPVVITTQGLYCLKSDKSSSQTSGIVINIQANNVTIDLNGFKLGGLGAGTATGATGIGALNHQNIIIRNGIIRGFFAGIALSATSVSASSGHLIEDVLLDTNREVGIDVAGSGYAIRNNRVVNTGPNPLSNAFGIVVSGPNAVVADNIISGISETGNAAGISVSSGTLVELRNNTILDTKDATNKFGIQITSSTDVTVIGNRILNVTGTGTQGINASGSTVNCINNTVAGFTNALAGCNFLANNVTP